MYAKFKIRFPEFEQLEQARFDAILAEAETEVSASVWGKFYEIGILNLIAHMLASEGFLNKGGATPDPIREVASKTIGSLSVSYASNKSGFETEKGNYHLTKYGQRYLELKRLVMPHFGLVR